MTQLDLFAAAAEAAVGGPVDLTRPPLRTFMGPRPPGHRRDCDTWIWSVCDCGWRSREYREYQGSMAHTIEDRDHAKTCVLVAAYETARADRLRPVLEWSLRIHGAGDPRDHWARNAAAALLRGSEPAPFPSHMPGVAAARLAMVRRLLELDDADQDAG